MAQTELFNARKIANLFLLADWQLFSRVPSGMVGNVHPTGV